MAQISRPWNGVTTGDAGPYTDQQWQITWGSIIGLGGRRANVGVLLGSGTQPFDGLRVIAQSPVTTNVDVHPGAALVQGISYLNTAVVSLAVGANVSGNPRIDTVILRADYALQTVRLALKAGTPAATPTPPVLTQIAGVMWEIPIADIAAANAFASITDANITPRQEWLNAAAGIYLDNVLNNSGGDLETGDLVINDSSANRAATTTTRANDPRAMGVWVGRTASGSYGRVLKSGIGYVKANGAVTRGQRMVSSGTVKQAAVNTSAEAGRTLATALETTSGAGLVLCHVTGWPGVSKAIIADQKASTTAGGSPTANTWTTRTLNTEVSDPDGIVSVAANQFTPIAGIYNVKIYSPMVGSGNPTGARIRLRNVTTGAVLKTSPNFSGNANGGIPATLEHTIIANGTDAFDTQYYITSALLTNGLGVPVSEAGVVEQYTTIDLELVG